MKAYEENDIKIRAKEILSSLRKVDVADVLTILTISLAAEIIASGLSNQNAHEGLADALENMRMAAKESEAAQ